MRIVTNGRENREGRSQTRDRQKWIEFYRGIAIIAVIGIHVTGHSLRMVEPMSLRWLALAIINRILMFAVPAFLFVSAYGNTLSLTAKPDLRSFYARRLRSAGAPFLLCSIAGILVTAWQSHMLPTLCHAIHLIMIGRGYYHLYFMVLLLELYLMLPAAVRIARKLSRNALMLFIIAVQSLVYVIHRIMPALDGLSTSIAWCVAPVLLGVWCALDKPHPADRPARSAWALTGIAACAYVSVGAASLAHPVNTAAYQFLEWIYGAAASWALARVCMRWSGTTALPQSRSMAVVADGLAMLGRRSFVIYLIHPFVLQAAIAITTRFGELPGAAQAILWTVAALTFPVVAAQGFEKVREWKKAKTGVGSPVSEKRGEPSHGSGTALARS